MEMVVCGFLNSKEGDQPSLSSSRWLVNSCRDLASG